MGSFFGPAQDFGEAHVSATNVAVFLEASSDPKLIDVMHSAYGKACRMLHDKGQPLLVQEVIARRIVKIAETGEHDPNRICQRVMVDLGLQRDQ
jgi:hypothetical protein